MSSRAMGLRSGLVVLLIALAGCIESNRPEPSACAVPSVTLRLELTETAMAPSDPAVCRGQQVTLLIESEVDGVLHLHGYDEQLPATSVVAGETVELQLTAERSGQFPVELHTQDDPGGASVAIFTVHER